MESASEHHYAAEMPHQIAQLLGAALRDIRKRTTRTQEAWEERTEMSQSYLSSVERGQSGWDSIETIAAHIEQAGADPVDLLRLAVAQVDQDDAHRELVALWAAAKPEVRTAVLTLLRSSAQGPQTVAR